jgi:hypothetical protein
MPDKGTKRNERNAARMLPAFPFMSFKLILFECLTPVFLLLDQPGSISALQKADPSFYGITQLVDQAKQIDPKISTVSQY